MEGFIPNHSPNYSPNLILDRLDRKPMRAFIETTKSQYKRKDGTIVAFYRVRYGDNFKKSKSFKSHTDAKNWRDDFNARFKNSPKAVAYLKWTFPMLADVYQEEKFGIRKDGDKLTAKEREVRYISDWFKGVKLIDLNKELVKKFKEYIQANSLRKSMTRSPRTVNSYLVTLRTVLNFGKAEGYVTVIPNVSSLIDKDLEKKRTNYINHAEFLSLLAACDEERKGHDRQHLKLILMGLYYTGARRSELAKIRVRDVNLDADVILVNNAKRKDEDTRLCYLGSDLKQALIESGIKDKNPSELAFGDIHNYKRSFATAKRISGIDADFRIHDLRRCAITNMLQAGFTPHVVQAMVGHSVKSAMTLDVYRKLQPDFIASEGTKIDKYFEVKNDDILNADSLE